MNMGGADSVKSYQIALFTFVTQTGIGVITLPSALAKEAGHDGWIPIFLAGFIAVILSAAIVFLLRRYKNKAIYDINRLIFGKVAGAVLNGLLTAYLIFAAALGMRIFSLFIFLTVLSNTPPLLVTAVVISPSIILVWYGLKSVCRFLYMTIFSHILLVAYFIVCIPKMRISFLMPVGEAGVITLLTSVKTSYFAFVGFELLVFFFPEVINKEKVMKHQILASVFSMVFFLIVVVVSTSIFGEHLLKIQTIPLFNLARACKLPVLERIDVYFIALWFIAVGCSVRAYIFASYYSLKKVFKYKQTKLLYMLFFVFIILTSRIPKDMNDVLMYLDILNYTAMGVAAFLVLCLLLSFVRKRRTDTG